jgi:acyl dehydratase
MSRSWTHDVQTGQPLPAFEAPPVSRLALALYCGASGDHNPVHVDSDFARNAGLDDVFAHGMLSMAWLGHVLTGWIPQQSIREYGVRFAAVTRVGERICCNGEVVEVVDRNGERQARVAVRTRNQSGELKLEGDAWVALGPPVSNQFSESK